MARARFKKGNKLAKGGRRKGAGRKPDNFVQVQKAAADIAREYIEASVKPVMHTYFQLAHGRLVNKYHEGQIVGQEFEADAPTTRHFIDKLLPEIKPDGATRPIAIQVIVEEGRGVSVNGNANGNGASAKGARNGGPILTIGS